MRADTDADVCYRHPDRASWTLCDRCGRTICPECQIATPNGVLCPDCVRETAGSAPRWVPASSASGSTGGSSSGGNVTPMKRRAKSPAWITWLKSALLPDSGAPVISWAFVGLAVLVSLVNLITGNALLPWLIGVPGPTALQLWRFVTAAFITTSLLGLVLNVVFFLLTGPTLERLLGRRRFLLVLLAGIVVGNAAMLIAGAPAYGMTGALFGLFAAFFIWMRARGASTVQFLIMIAINIVITLVLAPIFIIMMVGGALGGGGAAALFHFHDDRGTRKQSTIYWQYTALVGGFAGLAILVGVLSGFAAG
jgi:membrane associated rhomboid family serine protease